jgi:hypothetical protein
MKAILVLCFNFLIMVSMLSEVSLAGDRAKSGSALAEGISNYVAEFEKDDSKLVQSLAEFKKRQLKLKESGWKPPWQGYKDVKERSYYEKLSTEDLAGECFSTSLWAREMLIYDRPAYGIARAGIFHDGFAVLYERPDFWEAIASVYIHLARNLTELKVEKKKSNPETLSAEEKKQMDILFNLKTLQYVYTYPLFLQTLKGKEELLLRANLEALRAVLSYAGESEYRDKPFWGATVAYGLTRPMFALLKRTNPDKYSEILGRLKNTELSFKSPDPEQTRSYIRLVVSTVEQALADTAGSSKSVWDAAWRFDSTRKGYSVEKGRVVVDLGDEKSLCPGGLLGSTREQTSIKEIVFRYHVSSGGRSWLHIIWNPGGSGKERFEVLFNGKSVGKSQLVNGSKTPNQEVTELFPVEHESGQSEIMLRRLSGNGLIFDTVLLSTGKKMPARLKPTLKFPTLASYAKEIGEPAVVFDDAHVRFYAPKRKEKEAKIIHGYLVRAYDELYRIVGVHTKYKIVVYPLPKSNPLCFGGTGGCTIWHPDTNLDFESLPEWKLYHVPHVSGYIEEMAHNFVSASLTQFGWEMTGWSISKIVSEKVAGNPFHRKTIAGARKMQAETFLRYKKLNNTFPKDIPSNKCDRIHAHLLYQCKMQYGPDFWPDFFREIRKVRPQLLAASSSGPGDERRNARYRITIDCFDRIMKGRFKKMLKKYGISLTKDIKSLHPNEPGWNRKLQ